jgi:hypothetical protein
MEDLTSCFCNTTPSTTVDTTDSTTVTVEREPLSTEVLIQVVEGLCTFFAAQAMHGWVDHLMHMYPQQGLAKEHPHVTMTDSRLAAARASNEGSEHTSSTIAPATPEQKHLRGFERGSILSTCTHSDAEVTGAGGGELSCLQSDSSVASSSCIGSLSNLPPDAAAPSAVGGPSGSSGSKQLGPGPKPRQAGQGPRQSVLAEARSMGFIGCLRLLASGFPNAQQERRFQAESSTSLLRAVAPLGLMFEAVAATAAVVHMWQAGKLSHWRDAYNLIPLASSVCIRTLVHLRYGYCSFDSAST